MSGKEIWELLFDNHIKLWINETHLFFTKPRQFLFRFLRKPFFEKLYQVLFYLLIGAILTWTCFNGSIVDYDFKESVKLWLELLPSLFYRIIALIISCWLFCKISKTRFQVDAIIWFIIIARLLFSPIETIFSSIFLTYENYNFLLILNLIALPYAVYSTVFPILYTFNKKRIRIVCIIFSTILISLFGVISILFSNDAREFNSNNIVYDTKKENNLSDDKITYNNLKKSAYFTLDPLTAEFIDFDDHLSVNFFETPTMRFIDIAGNGDTIYNGVVLSRCIDSKGIADLKCQVSGYYDSLQNSIEFITRNEAAHLKFKVSHEYYMLVKQYYEEILNHIDQDLPHDDDVFLRSDTMITNNETIQIRKVFKVDLEEVAKLRKEILRKKEKYRNSIIWATEPYLTFCNWITFGLDSQKANFDFYPLDTNL